MSFRPFPEAAPAIEALQEGFHKLLERVWHAGMSAGPFDGQDWAPVLDMHEHDDHFVVLAEVPGVDAGEVDITLLGHSLTLRGAKRRPDAATDKNRALRAERRYGTFCRTIELPEGVDVERMTAKCSNGVLEIVLPKKESFKPRTVKVRVEEAGA